VRLLDRSATVLLLLVALLAAVPGAAQAVPAPGTLSAGLSAPASPVGRAVAVSGAVTPAVPGQVVTLWRWRAGAWHGVDRQPQTATGAFRFVVAPDALGWWSYRVTAGPLAVELPKLDVHRVLTYSVATRGQVGPDGAGFAAAVAAVYADPRGWLRSHRRFARVATGGDFTVVLASASLLPSYSRSCSVLYSCRVGRNVVLNADRWRSGARAFPGSLAQYRQMVLNHETGHWLGLGHASCPGRGRPAPVMQQQSKGMQGCAPNAWPLDHELAGVRR
jgi:hypothetical protein